MDRYDVIVCGAGISGLLIASEISKNYSVLVIEKNSQLMCSNKFWLTSKEALEKNEKLIGCIDSEWSAMDFISNRKSKFTVKGEYILWDTKKLEKFLLNIIEANGSKVLYGHRFYSYRYLEDGILLNANQIIIHGKIMIDCMGYSSPLVGSSNVVTILGYHHLYGCTMKLKQKINPIAIDNVLLSKKPSYLEIFPKSNNQANVVLISPAKTTNNIDSLRKDFDFIVKKSHYSKVLQSIENREPLHGIVPIGQINKRALDRILFFGEAGQIHPAASCTCLNKLLLSYKLTASKLQKNLETGNLSSQDLQNVVPHMNKFSQKFHQNLFKQMNSWTSDQLDLLIDLLHCLDQKSLDDLIFGEINIMHFMQFDNLKRVAQKQNFIWLKPLLKTFFNL